MRDIPVFTTENGVASLFLKEIPYKQTAYIRLQDSAEPAKLLQECVGFCVAAGAQNVYATGHDCLTDYPVHTAVLRMCRSLDDLPQTDAALFPVQSKAFETWRKIYNEKMSCISGAATVSAFDERKILNDGGAYFVHRAEQLLGIGMVSDGQIDAIASLVPGAGEDVLAALCSALAGETVSLEVAENNTAAIRLYQRLGFIITSEVCRWYEVL